MAFSYPSGTAGVTIGGRDLSEFSAKLLSAYTLGACGVETDVFQGKNRSSLLLLNQTFGALKLVLPLEFWGQDRADAAAKWSAFCAAASGQVELDLGDGYIYPACVTDFGTPAWITEGYFAVDVTFRAMRQKPTEILTVATDPRASVHCSSTFPRTDCILTLPQALLGGADEVQVVLGENRWGFREDFTGAQTLVLDGVNKTFLLDGKVITPRANWEDFPYLVPGDNRVEVLVNTIGVTVEAVIQYRPTFL